MPSFKFTGGKFVPRTEKEERRIAEYSAETAKSERTPRKREPFIQLTLGQLDRLVPRLSKSPQVSIFFVLCFESFRHYGGPFVWPADKLFEIGGFRPRTQRRVAAHLERRA